MNKKELDKAFQEKLITKEQYAEELFKLATAPKKKITRKLPTEITEEEFLLITKNTKSKHHKVAFLLGFCSGLRISEVINLKPEDIRLKEKTILIRQGKGSKDRIVPLAKGFKDNMMEYIPMKCRSARALQKAFRGICIKTGILEKKPDVCFHSLRHGFANRCIKNGMNINDLRILMGHTNISTTNVYLTTNPKDALKSYEDLF